MSATAWRVAALVAAGFGVSWSAWRAVVTRSWWWAIIAAWYATVLVSLASAVH